MTRSRFVQIFRQEAKEIQLCAAQAYLKLGEVGIESGKLLKMANTTFLIVYGFG